MDLDIERVGKPPRKLRRLLKKFPPNPDPETVHQLRTQMRRLEATLHALSPQNPVKARRMLKVLKPIRRAAGRVRDMDVLIVNSAGLSVQSDGLIRLIEHMSAIRTADASRLHRKVKRSQREARSLLKDFARNLRRLPPDRSGMPARSASPQILAEKLDHYPGLNQQNLHEFRKTVKELGYMLQLVPHPDNLRLNAYEKVKDTTGDWHDWLELKCLAESVLDPGEDTLMLSEIRGILQKKFHTALNAANALRRGGIELVPAA